MGDESSRPFRFFRCGLVRIIAYGYRGKRVDLEWKLPSLSKFPFREVLTPMTYTSERTHSTGGPPVPREMTLALLLHATGEDMLNNAWRRDAGGLWESLFW